MGRSERGSAAQALLLLQISLRLITFALNQVLIRTTSPAVFGAANVQLELVLSIVLSLAREGVRAVMMRQQDELRRGASPATHNVALVPVVAGSLLSVSVGYAYLHWFAPTTLWEQGGDAVPWSVTLYCIGALLELFAEPLYTYALGLPQFVMVRMAMEAGGVLAKSIVNVVLLQPVCLAWMARSLGSVWHVPSMTTVPYALLAFGCARVAYGGMVLLVASISIASLRSWRTVGYTLCPQQGCTMRDHAMWSLIRVTTGQSILKLLLTEGDKMAMTRFTTLDEQGGYALASNYGSLIARTFFQPMEESSRLHFAPCASSRSNADQASAAQLLSVMLHLHMLLGTCIVAAAPPLAPSLLAWLAGPQWADSSAAAILASYCWYIPVMGLNGMAEAFVQAVAPPKVLAWYSRILLGSSAMFWGTLVGGSYVPLLASLGASRMVWANVLALSVRVAASFWYIQQYWASTPFHAQMSLSSLLPHTSVLSVCVGCAMVGRAWLAPAMPLLPMLASMAGMGLCMLMALYVR